MFIQIGNMTDTINQMINQFISFAPNLFSAIVILIVGLIISKFVASVTRRFLVKIQVDKFGEKLNEIELIQKSNLTIKLSAVFSKFIYYFLLVFFLVAASDVLNMAAISELVLGLFNLIPKLIVGLIIFIFGMLIAEGIRSVVQTTLTSLGIPSAKIIASVLFYFLFINVIISAIAQAEINTAFLEQNLSIIIGGAVLAFAIGYGLASKDVLANFLSSFYAKDKVEIGDVVTIDNEKGEVIAMDRNSVTIEADDRLIIYPLKVLLNEKVSIHKN